MGLLLRQLKKRSSLANPSQYLKDYFAGSFGIKNESGILVSESNADSCVAVGACIDRISKQIATLPLDLYKKGADNSRIKAVNHPLYYLLKYQPCNNMTAYNWRLIMTQYYLKWGAAYAKIEWNNNGVITNLWPIPSGNVRPYRKDNELNFEVWTTDGSKYAILDADEVFRVYFATDDGVTPKSPIRKYAESIGVALAQERYASRFFGAGANVAGVLTHPGKLDPNGDAFRNLRKSWEEVYSGIDNSHKVVILEEGMTYNKIGLSPEDSQLLQSRQFQTEEICRIYDMPLDRIQLNYQNSSTYANTEQHDLQFMKYTILPHTVNWQQAISMCLLTSEKYFAEFNFDMLLKADAKTRSAFYHQLVSDGIINADEIRAMENWNPQKFDAEGDIGSRYYILANYMEKTKSTNLTQEAGGNYAITST